MGSTNKYLGLNRIKNASISSCKILTSFQQIFIAYYIYIYIYYVFDFIPGKWNKCNEKIIQITESLLLSRHIFSPKNQVFWIRGVRKYKNQYSRWTFWRICFGNLCCEFSRWTFSFLKMFIIRCQLSIIRFKRKMLTDFKFFEHYSF